MYGYQRPGLIPDWIKTIVFLLLLIVIFKFPGHMARFIEGLPEAVGTTYNAICDLVDTTLDEEEKPEDDEEYNEPEEKDYGLIN